MNNFDWQWWQYFIAIFEHGSMNRAALSLGVSQPTLSRQLLAMENQLGQSLFDRSTQGLTLTMFGQGLLEEGQRMQSSAERLQRLAQGHTQTLTGRIRLSVNELIAQYYLPKILPSFMDSFPDLSVEIDVSNETTSLDKRDADIAVRMFPPTQPDVVARHLFDIPLGFFASKEYLDKHNHPSNTAELFKLRVLGYDRSRQFEEGAQRHGLKMKNEHFKFRCDFMPLHLELAIRHGGIVATHQSLATKAGLLEIRVGIDLPVLPVYLVCHRDIQHNKNLRAIMDFLVSELPKALTKIV